MYNIDADGIGTVFREPIEVEPLAGVFTESSDSSSMSHSLMVWDVNSNIGHLDMEAGMVGPIKKNCYLDRIIFEQMWVWSSWILALPTSLSPLHTILGKNNTENVVAGVIFFG